jgi:hypothetical protein
MILFLFYSESSRSIVHTSDWMNVPQCQMHLLKYEYANKILSHHRNLFRNSGRSMLLHLVSQILMIEALEE